MAGRDCRSRTQTGWIATPVILVLLMLCCCQTACRDKTAPPSVTSTEKQNQVTLQIGIIPEQNVFLQKKRYEPLAHYLGNKIGAKLELQLLSRYGNIIDNFMELGLDGAFFGSFTGAMASKKLNVDFLARPEDADGVSSYYGIIFTRKDSGINNAVDMKGKCFAFVDRATTAGWLLPLFYFKEQGIEDYATWLGEVYFAGTHEDTIRDVLDRRADIGAAKDTIFHRFAAKDNRVLEDLQILARSPNVPHNALAVRQDLDGKLKESLKNALLEMDKDEEGRLVLKNFGEARFIETTSDDYTPVFEYVQSIGLDLGSYKYFNE